MDVLELITKHLGFFLSIGIGITELKTTSKAVGVVVTEIFKVSVRRGKETSAKVCKQRIEGVPRAYMNLRAAALELMEEMHFALEAGKHFDSGLARRAVDELIHLVVRVSIKIRTCFSRSALGEQCCLSRCSCRN